MARFRKDLGDLTDLKESILKHGLIHPIVLDSNGELIAGERRLKACQELGIEPVFRTVDFNDPKGAEIDENTKRKEFTPSEIYEIGKYYNEKLSRQKEGINQYTKKEGLSDSDRPKENPRDIVSKVTGISTDTVSKINQIFEGDNDEIKKKVDQKKISVDKAYKEVKKQKKEKEKETALSDIPKPKEKNEISIESGWYKLNNQYLYFGSNTDKKFIDFLPKDAAFAFADPPYNANVDKWDNGFIWQQDYLQNIAKTVAVTPGGWNAFEFYRQTEMNYQWEMFCWITNGMTHGKCGFANVIKASIFGKEKPKISQDFWKINIRVNETDHTKHKGRKPYEFMYHLIDMFSNKGDKIIDPFAGSGTTLIVSEQMDRISYNAELSKDFCVEIIKRAGHYERI